MSNSNRRSPDIHSKATVKMTNNIDSTQSIKIVFGHLILQVVQSLLSNYHRNTTYSILQRTTCFVPNPLTIKSIYTQSLSLVTVVPYTPIPTNKKEGSTVLRTRSDWLTMHVINWIWHLYPLLLIHSWTGPNPLN